MGSSSLSMGVLETRSVCRLVQGVMGRVTAHFGETAEQRVLRPWTVDPHCTLLSYRPTA